MDPHNDSQPHSDAAPETRDAVRSRAWRNRHSQHLQGLLRAAGAEAQGGSARSHMATLKKVFAGVWAQALTAAPASMIRHDPSLTRAERRRISSVKNNRLCRHRHHVFLQGIEHELQGRGLLPAGLSHQGPGSGHSSLHMQPPEFGTARAPAAPAGAPARQLSQPAHPPAPAAAGQVREGLPRAATPSPAHAHVAVPGRGHPSAPQPARHPSPGHAPAATGPVPVRSLRPNPADKF